MDKVEADLFADERMRQTWESLAAVKKDVSELKSDVTALKEQVALLRARL